MDPVRTQQPAEHYDPAIHVTARQLRKERIVVPRNVPDRAWIARSLVRPRQGERRANGTTYRCLTADFDGPFLLAGPPDG